MLLGFNLKTMNNISHVVFAYLVIYLRLWT